MPVPVLLLVLAQLCGAGVALAGPEVSGSESPTPESEREPNADEVAAAVASAYAVWQQGDLAQARTLAERALALDGSLRTLVARRVLVLALDGLGEPVAAMAALEDYLSFALTERDRTWAEGLLPTLRAKVPAPVAAGTERPAPDPAPEAVDGQGRAAPGEGSRPDAAVNALVRPARVTIAVGGAYARLGASNYGGGALDLALRLVGPLHVGAGARVLLSELTGCGGAEGSAPSDRCRTLLVAPTVGLGLRAPTGPAAPYVELRALLAPERGVPGRGPLRAGLTLGGGVEIPIPAGSPLALRPHVAFDLLFGDGAPTPGLLVGLDLAVRVAGRGP